MFYNGEEDYPESTTLRLSGAFMTMLEKPALEVVVSVTNINYTKGSEILHTCKPLKEYTLFVDAVQREEEREIALKEGSYQAKLETAKTMLAMHYPLEDICKITGLTEAKIEQL